MDENENKEIIVSSTVQNDTACSNESENENEDAKVAEEQLREELKQEIIAEMRQEEEEDLWRCAKARLKGSIIFLIVCIIIFFSTAVITAWSS